MALGEFVVARNPDPDSALPYLLRLPLEGGLVLKAREPWPATSRVYCHPAEGWPDEPDVIESTPVRECRRRGVAVDLVLDRKQNNRAQFVFTTVRERPAIFWQTARALRSARPGVRVPSRKASKLRAWQIEVDTRERYPYRFAKHTSVSVARHAVRAGDYAVRGGDGEVLASVERKTIPDLTKGLVEGSLAFTMADLATLPAAAVVVEGRYSDLFKEERVQPGWLPELVARLQVRYRDVPIVFAETRPLAEEWTYRFLAAALREYAPPDEDAPADGTVGQ